MSRKIISFALLGLVVAVMAPGCQKLATSAGGTTQNKAEAEVGLGVQSGHTYTNEYFGLTITIPESWHIQSREEAEEMSRMGQTMMTGKGSHPSLKAAVEAGQANTVNMMSAFLHPPGTPGVLNPSVLVLAERVKHLPGIRSGQEYCAQLKQTLGMTTMRYEFEPVESGLKIGSFDAHCLPVRMNVGAVTVRQRYYATRHKDYVLCVIASYFTDDQKEAIEKIISEIKTVGK